MLLVSLSSPDCINQPFHHAHATLVAMVIGVNTLVNKNKNDKNNVVVVALLALSSKLLKKSN